MKSFGIGIGGRKVSRNADDTALCAENHEEIVELQSSVNEGGEKTWNSMQRKPKGPVSVKYFFPNLHNIFWYHKVSIQ